MLSNYIFLPGIKMTKRQDSKVMKQGRERGSVREHRWLGEKILNKTCLSVWVNIHPVIRVSTFNKVLGLRELRYCAFWLCIETEIATASLNARCADADSEKPDGERNCLVSPSNIRKNTISWSPSKN